MNNFDERVTLHFKDHIKYDLYLLPFDKVACFCWVKSINGEWSHMQGRGNRVRRKIFKCSQGKEYINLEGGKIFLEGLFNHTGGE